MKIFDYFYFIVIFLFLYTRSHNTLFLVIDYSNLHFRNNIYSINEFNKVNLTNLCIFLFIKYAKLQIFSFVIHSFINFYNAEQDKYLISFKLNINFFLLF